MTAAASVHGPWREIVASARMVEAGTQIAQSADRAAAAAAFWDTVTATPLWERDPELSDAWRATFLWRGEPELTRHVTLCGGVVFSEECGIPLEHIDGTDIWHLALRLPARTRSEYVLSPNGLLRPPEQLSSWGRLSATWVRDPLNPSTLVIPTNPAVPEITPRLLSVLEAPDVPPRRWSVPAADTVKGRLEEHAHASRALQNTRRIWTYEPAGWDPGQGPLPLVVAFDGWDAVNITRLPVVLDNLIAAGSIPPVLAVLVESGTLAMRFRELDRHEPFVTFLADELLPWANERWDRVHDRSRTLVTGISLGGKAAVFAGLRRPDLFGLVLAQSAAVTESPDVLDALAGRSVEHSSERLGVYLDVGLLEIDPRGELGFLTGVRRLRDILRQAGHDVQHVELACGHDDIAAGEAVADGLRHLLAGQAAPGSS